MGLRLAGRAQGIATRIFGVDCDSLGAAAELTLVARRNNSLSSGVKFLVLNSLALVVGAISLGFAFHGAWLVLPFAGLDLLGVVMVFRCLERHAGDYECLAFRGDRVVLERRDRGSVSRFEFNRDRVQTTFIEAQGGERGRLLLRSHGKKRSGVRHSPYQ